MYAAAAQALRRANPRRGARTGARERAALRAAALAVVGLAAATAVAACGHAPPVEEPAPRVEALAPSTLPIEPGGDSALTVTLDRVAPAGGAVVQLYTSNAGVADVPMNVTVATGVRDAAFAVLGGGKGRATVTAALNASTAVATVVVGNPPPPPLDGGGPPPDAGLDDSGDANHGFSDSGGGTDSNTSSDSAP
jgi:hypothetical protein